MNVMINRMSAAISGTQVTLTKTVGISEAHPGYLDASSIVINTTMNPAPGDFWKAAATGLRYSVTIEVET